MGTSGFPAFGFLLEVEGGSVCRAPPTLAVSVRASYQVPRYNFRSLVEILRSFENVGENDRNPCNLEKSEAQRRGEVQQKKRSILCPRPPRCRATSPPPRAATPGLQS